MHNKNILSLIIILIVAFILRIILMPYGTYHADLVTFQLWSFDLAVHGIKNAYTQTGTDYTPGYLYVLWFLGRAYYKFANYGILFPFEMVYKMPAVIADIFNGLFIYLIAKRFTAPKKALIAAMFFLFNPAVILTSALWGQVESIITLFLLASLFLLFEDYIFLSAIALGICQSIKPFSLFILPIYLIYVWRKTNIPKTAGYLLIFIITAIVCFIPFDPTGNPVKFFLDVNQKVNINRWPFITLNAFNLWSVFAYSPTNELLRVPDQQTIFIISKQLLGYLMFCAVYLLVLARFYFVEKTTKNFRSLIITASAIIYLGMFIFLTRMHERHLFYVLGFLPLLPFIYPVTGTLALIGLSLTYTYNVYYSLAIVEHFPIIFNYALLLITIVINFIMLGILFKILWQGKITSVKLANN